MFEQANSQPVATVPPTLLIVDDAPENLMVLGVFLQSFMAAHWRAFRGIRAAA
jgi:hypothetical protein